MAPELHLTISVISIRLLVALVIGIIIGMEREIQHKAAGLRTSVLICLGSTIFTLSSIGFATISSNVDPSRIAAQIVTGIGFLGAGTIIQTRGSVHGLTTAATIWVMSALGVAVGFGSYGMAIIGAILSVIVLNAFQAIEHAVKGKKTTCTYTLKVTDTGPALSLIMLALQRSPSEVKEFKITQEEFHHLITFNFTEEDKQQMRIADELAKTPGVIQINSDQCS
jgi:putative Mg2+ transporter-C (MgtC) family protein